MNQRPDISPYWFNQDQRINASLTLAKLQHRIIRINPSYKPATLYQARMKLRQNKTWHFRRVRAWSKNGARTEFKAGKCS